MEAIDRLARLTTLVLNADHRPLGLAGWREAIESTIRMSCYAVSFHAEAARSPGGTYPVPSVMVRERYVRVDGPAAYSRRNVFMAYAIPGRDGRPTWRCALCGGEAAESELTFDHVVPRSLGGRSDWGNCCLAHSGCNQRKGNGTLAQAGIPRLHVPLRRPTDYELNRTRLRFAVGRTPPADWADFVSELYWDVALES